MQLGLGDRSLQMADKWFNRVRVVSADYGYLILRNSRGEISHVKGGMVLGGDVLFDVESGTRKLIRCTTASHRFKLLGQFDPEQTARFVSELHRMNFPLSVQYDSTSMTLTNTKPLSCIIELDFLCNDLVPAFLSILSRKTYEKQEDGSVR